MTGETTWNKANHSNDLLELLQDDLFAGRIDRKWRLYLCACARRLDSQLSPAERQATEAAEELADSETPCRELRWTSFGCWPVQKRSGIGRRYRNEQGADADSTENERRIKAALINDIFGNRFCPVDIDPRWLSSTVFDLARTIYDERLFERLPILADALMDAGCDSEDILSHCHHKGPHVRGCWVVDLLLGKS